MKISSKWRHFCFGVTSHHLRHCWFIVDWALGTISDCEIWIKIKQSLTHWGRVTHICVSKPTTIGSDNGLSPGRRQAIMWTNAGILLIGPSGTNLSEISSEIYTFLTEENAFENVVWKMAAILSRPQCVNERKRVWKYRLHWQWRSQCVSAPAMDPLLWERLGVKYGRDITRVHRLTLQFVWHLFVFCVQAVTYVQPVEKKMYARSIRLSTNVGR